MLGCRRVRDDLTAWIDAELPRRRDARLRRHLTACAQCAAAAELMRATVAAQRRLLPVAVATSGVDPQMLWGKLQQSLADAAHAPPLRAADLGWMTRRWWWVPRPVALAGGVMVVAGVILLLSWVGGAGTVLAPLGVVSPPVAVTRAPELFKDYPLIEQLDALEYFDTVQSVPLDDDQAAHRG